MSKDPLNTRLNRKLKTDTYNSNWLASIGDELVKSSPINPSYPIPDVNQPYWDYHKKKSRPTKTNLKKPLYIIETDIKDSELTLTIKDVIDKLILRIISEDMAIQLASTSKESFLFIDTKYVGSSLWSHKIKWGKSIALEQKIHLYYEAAEKEYKNFIKTQVIKFNNFSSEHKRVCERPPNKKQFEASMNALSSLNNIVSEDVYQWICNADNSLDFESTFGVPRSVWQPVAANAYLVNKQKNYGLVMKELKKCNFWMTGPYKELVELKPKKYLDDYSIIKDFLNNLKLEL